MNIVTRCCLPDLRNSFHKVRFSSKTAEVAREEEKERERGGGEREDEKERERGGGERGRGREIMRER